MHSDEEKSWIDVYTSIDINRALLVGNKIWSIRKFGSITEGGKYLENSF